MAVHGYAGFLGVCTAGYMLWGYPSSPNPAFARITPWGQFAGACITFWGLGFVPTHVITGLLKALGTLPEF